MSEIVFNTANNQEKKDLENEIEHFGFICSEAFKWMEKHHHLIDNIESQLISNCQVLAQWRIEQLQRKMKRKYG